MSAVRVFACCLALLSLTAPASAQENVSRRRTPVVDVFEKCRNAVVNISTTRVVRMRSLGESPLDEIFNLGPREMNRQVQSVGSGVVIHELGYIVTNAHVVSQASDVRVTFNDHSVLPARVIAIDPQHDLAVLRVDAGRKLPSIAMGRSDDIMIGETVIAIGNPLGLQHTVTAGIVSALDRELKFSEEATYRQLIQTDASINPGNSGGPLLNVDGELIGINTAIRGDAQNIGFAIGVDRLWEWLPAMLDVERHERVRVGLQVSGRGAVVEDVRADTPAAQAGLRVGDRILRMDDGELANGIDFYVRLLTRAAGDEVRLSVQRGGEQLTRRLVLQPIPLPDGRALAGRLLGMEIAEIPAELREKYELPGYVGLMVESVDSLGPADRARIRPTDLILAIDRTPVSSLKDIGLILESVPRGEAVIVDGIRLRSDYPFRWTVSLRTR